MLLPSRLIEVPLACKPELASFMLFRSEFLLRGSPGLEDMALDPCALDLFNFEEILPYDPGIEFDWALN